MSKPLIVVFILIYVLHLVLGAGAGYAALRLWRSRHHPLVWRVIVYIHGFIIEAITSVVLLFVSQGTHFTQRFAAVLFGGMLLGDAVRAFLIAYLIKGPAEEHPLSKAETSESVSQPVSCAEFRLIMREEVANALRSVEWKS